MDDKRAIRVIGSLALKCHAVFRCARAANMPYLCLKAAINMADAFCAWHKLENEQKRTESLNSMICEATEKLAQRNKKYERDTEFIISEQRRLASEKLDNLLWELKKEQESLKMKFEEAQTRAANKATEIAANESAQNSLRVHIAGFMKVIEDAITAANQAGREIPQSIMDQYSFLLRRYRELI